MKKFAIFGASNLGSEHLKELATKQVVPMAYFDNNPNLWGKKVCNIPVLKPTSENLNNVDLILIASCYKEEIIEQIIKLGQVDKVRTTIDALLHSLGLGKNKESPKTKKHSFDKKNENFQFFRAGRPNQEPSSKATPTAHIACTGCANNHIALAKTLAQSFLHFHPNSRFFIFLVDKKKESIHYPDQDDERIEVIEAESLGIKHFRSLAFKYDIYELSTALRPYEVDYLLNKRGFKSILMIDPDMLITAPLAPLFEVLETSSLLLFPHMVFPSVKPACSNELNVLRSGVFNCGLLGFMKCEETQAFIRWWKLRLDTHCHNAQEKGFFVDQKWMNFAPALFPGVNIVRDPSYNVAYWNLFERPILGSECSYTTHGKPLHCFHFSGMRAEDWKDPLKRINTLSGISYSLKNPINELLHLYREIIAENGFFENVEEPYAYGSFSNGVPIAPVIRKIFAKYEELLRINDPFNANSLDSFYSWLNQKSKPEKSVSRLISEIGSIEGLPLINPAQISQRSETRSLARALAYKQSLGIDDVFLSAQSLTSNN